MDGIEIQRRKANISQSELAQRVGVSQANISQWEKGSALPRADKLPLLAEALNCNIEDLYGVQPGRKTA